jgi:beta-galactosidase
MTENGRPAATCATETTGPAVALGLEVHPTFNATEIPADGRFAIPVTVFAVDSSGRRVPTASDYVTFSISGTAKIIGVGNGNPVCHEPDKASARSLFQGLAQVIVQTQQHPGEIALTATANALTPAALHLQSTESAGPACVPPAKLRYLISDWRMSRITQHRPDVLSTGMEQDVNSWDRIDPSAGPQPSWNNAAGYAVYRATCKAPKVLRQTGGRIVFHELIGEADAVLDGVAVGTKSDPKPGRFEVPFAAGVERATLCIVLRSESAPAGISAVVELLPDN